MPLGNIQQVASLEDGNYTPKRAVCFQNALVRYCIFSDGSLSPSNQYYWHDNQWIPFSNEALDLPVQMAVIAADWNEARHNYDFVHFVCALQVGKDKNNFNSWIFFNYFDKEITLGDWQMPTPCEVQVIEPQYIDIYGINSNTIAKWSLPSYPSFYDWLSWWQK